MMTAPQTPDTVPLILEAAVSLLLACPLARDESVHRLKQSRPGPESYGLYLNDGRQFHFRPGPEGHQATSLHGFDSYRQGKLVTKLDGHEAIWKFSPRSRPSPAPDSARIPNSEAVDGKLMPNGHVKKPSVLGRR
jgi:hypothetical protein